MSSMKQKRDREEACSTCGHYHDYEGGEPCSICGHVMLPPGKAHHESCMPTTIISGFLYLGSYDTASRQDLLKAMGITHVLNTVPSCPALYKNTFQYHTVAANPPNFAECFEFLDKVNEQKAKVLVYCMSGVTRSPSIVIGYLMKMRGWRLAESYKWVKDKRPQVNIGRDDTQRLQELEVQLRGSCSAPSGFAFISLPGFTPPGQEQKQQQQQQTQAPQQPASTGLFGLTQPAPWAAAGAGAPGGITPLGSAGSTASTFASGSNFVFGAAHTGAHHHQTSEVGNDMES